MDGLGGLPGPEGMTELETAHTTNLDALAKKGVCGLLDPVGYGMTPGSGPAHFALFGYDPVKNNIGRGILEGAGIDFPMTERDLLIRISFATINGDRWFWRPTPGIRCRLSSQRPPAGRTWSLISLKETVFAVVW